MSNIQLSECVSTIEKLEYVHFIIFVLDTHSE